MPCSCTPEPLDSHTALKLTPVMPLALGPLVQSIVEGELDSLESFMRRAIGSFTADADKLTSRLERDAAGLSSEEKDELYEFHSDEWYGLTDTCPRLFLNALFVTLVSMAEHQLLNIAAQAEKKHGQAIGKFKKGGNKSTIASVAGYLRRVPGLVFPSDHASWASLETYNRVRNAIVHQYGEAGTGTHADAIAFLAGKNAIDASTKRIMLTPVICEEALADVRTFFRELASGIPGSMAIGAPAV